MIFDDRLVLKHSIIFFFFEKKTFLWGFLFLIEETTFLFISFALFVLSLFFHRGFIHDFISILNFFFVFFI